MNTLIQIGWSLLIAAIMTGMLYLAAQLNATPVLALLATSVVGSALLMYSLREVRP